MIILFGYAAFSQTAISNIVNHSCWNMYRQSYVWVFLYLFGLLHEANGDNDAIFQRQTGRYLGNYVIRSLQLKSEFDCGQSCMEEPDCVSVNFKVRGKNQGLCELNSKGLEELQDEGQNDAEYVYLEIFRRVSSHVHRRK